MTWEFSIEDGVPLPPASRGRGPSKGSKFAPRLPLAKLAVGQSVFVPESMIDRRKLDRRIAGLNARRKTAMKFAVRVSVEQGITGNRIWRIE